MQARVCFAGPAQADALAALRDRVTRELHAQSELRFLANDGHCTIDSETAEQLPHVRVSIPSGSVDELIRWHVVNLLLRITRSDESLVVHVRDHSSPCFLTDECVEQWPSSLRAERAERADHLSRRAFIRSGRLWLLLSTTTGSDAESRSLPEYSADVEENSDGEQTLHLQIFVPGVHTAANLDFRISGPELTVESTGLAPNYYLRLQVDGVDERQCSAKFVRKRGRFDVRLGLCGGSNRGPSIRCVNRAAPMDWALEHELCKTHRTSTDAPHEISEMINLAACARISTLRRATHTGAELPTPTPVRCADCTGRAGQTTRWDPEAEPPVDDVVNPLSLHTANPRAQRPDGATRRRVSDLFVFGRQRLRRPNGT